MLQKERIGGWEGRKGTSGQGLENTARVMALQRQTCGAPAHTFWFSSSGVRTENSNFLGDADAAGANHRSVTWQWRWRGENRLEGISEVGRGGQSTGWRVRLLTKMGTKRPVLLCI